MSEMQSSATSATGGPFLPLGGGNMTGDLNTAAHLQVNGGVIPTVAAGNKAGVSPPAPLLATGANDVAGEITFGTGTNPGPGGQLIVVTFGLAWTIPGGGNPHVVISPSNLAAAGLNLYLSQLSVTKFVVSAANVPAASQPNTAYSFTYVVIG